MPRLRTDPTVDAQVRSQVAQSLTAELAVSCPDCGVEAGRACRDSFDRAVRTHLARAAAANRRDTEPCPAPPPTDGYWRTGIEQAESLTRAAAREFYEQVAASAAKAIGETQRPLKWLETADHGPDAIWFGIDPAASDGDYTARVTYRNGELVSVERAKTPTASDCAPSPAASAPDAVASTPTRPVCACGQTIEHVGEFGHAKIPSSICERCFLRETMACTDCSRPIERRRHWPFKGLFDGYGVHDENGDRTYCNDCWPRHDDCRRVPVAQPAPLDKRIAETKSDDAAECAWSTPTSDGEGWT